MSEIRRHTSSRVILLDDQDRVLMVKVRDDAIVVPGWPVSPEFWVLVGGGVEWGENWEDAALRAVFEETGLSGRKRASSRPWRTGRPTDGGETERVERETDTGELDLGPCVWTLDCEVLWSGEPVRVLERYFLGRVDGQGGRFDHADQAGREHRWWSQEELVRASARQSFRPPGLPDLLAEVLREPPDRPIAL